MLTLYNNAYSTCSQKVRLVLAEKSLDWQDLQISFALNEHLSAEYLELNPNGVVPTLKHDEALVIDSSVIMEYLDEVFPTPSMVPADAVGRAHLRAWLRYFEEVTTPAVRPPSFNQAFLRRYAAMSSQDFYAAVEKRPLRRRFIEKMGQSGFGDKDLEIAYENFGQTCERMERSLHTNAWLLGGARPSIADCCVAPLFDRMDDLGHARLWLGKPVVAAWLERFRARPSWRTTFYAGARLSDLYADLQQHGRPAQDVVTC